MSYELLVFVEMIKLRVRVDQHFRVQNYMGTLFILVERYRQFEPTTRPYNQYVLAKLYENMGTLDLFHQNVVLRRNLEQRTRILQTKQRPKVTGDAVQTMKCAVVASFHSAFGQPKFQSYVFETCVPESEDCTLPPTAVPANSLEKATVFAAQQAVSKFLQ